MWSCGYLIRSRTCVGLGSRAVEYFEARRGLRQKYVISSWLSNNFFDGMVRQLNERGQWGGKWN